MRLLLSGVVLAASSTLSLAADLPHMPAPAIAPPVPPPFTWGGYYLGITAGYLDGQHSLQLMGNEAATEATILDGRHPGSLTNNMNGLTGGFEVGWNYQFANTPFVFGIEADIQSGGGRSSTLYSITEPGNAAPIDDFRSRTDYLGSLRGRLGYAINNVLIYGTGGFAYGGVEDEYNIIAPNQRRSFNSSSSIQGGFAAGGGIAYAIPATGWMLKAEYLHYDLGNHDMAVLGPNNLFVTPANPLGEPRTFNSRIGVTADVFRVGVDYKFF